MTRLLQISLGTCALLVLVACGGQQGGGMAFGPQDIAEVQKRALEIAEDETARFQAIEDKYKTDVHFYAMSGHPFTPEHGVYAKVYREFKDAEVAEVTLTNDLLKPIAVDIEYTFDVYVTEGRSSTDADSPELAENDTEYSMRWEGDRTRTYYFDFEKNLTGDLPSPLDPVNYWTDIELSGWGKAEYE